MIKFVYGTEVVLFVDYDIYQHLHPKVDIFSPFPNLFRNSFLLHQTGMRSCNHSSRAQGNTFLRSHTDCLYMDPSNERTKEQTNKQTTFLNPFIRVFSHGVLVYVIGLHTAQFENNWTIKILRDAKLDEGIGRVQFGSQEFFEFNYFQIEQHIVLLCVNYIVHEICLGVRINS